MTTSGVVPDESNAPPLLAGHFDPSKVRFTTSIPGLHFVAPDGRVHTSGISSKLKLKTNPFTLEMWIKRDRLQGIKNRRTPQTIFHYGTASQRRFPALAITQLDERTRLSIHHDGMRATYDYKNLLPPDRLHHIVLTYDGLSINLFINAIHRASIPAPGWILDIPATSRVSIGNQPRTSNAFRGSVHLVALYNMALISPEVAANFRSGLAFPTSSSSSADGIDTSSTSSSLNASQESIPSTSSQAGFSSTTSDTFNSSAISQQPGGSGTSHSSSQSSASSSSNSDSPGGDNNGPPVINISLLPSRTACVAPCGIHFDAAGTTSGTSTRPFEDLHFFWNFGDPRAHYRTKPSVNANQATGGVTGHVFIYPGTYNVTLSVTDLQGNSATKSVEIRVADPELVFSPVFGGYTWCISSSGNFDDCPTNDPRFHLRDYSAAMSSNTLCLGNSGENFYPPRGPRRVLLRRGETFVGTSTGGGCLPYTDGAYDDYPLMLSAYGTGPDPVILAPLTGTSNPPGWLFGYHEGPKAGTTVTGISFQGRYDASTGLGEFIGGCLALWGKALSNATIFRNSFSGCAINIDLRSDQPAYAIVADNVSTNWQNFGLFGSIPHSAVIANSIEQHPDALSVNWDGKDGSCRSAGVCVAEYGDHGAMRVGQSGHTSICHNNLTSRNSWIGLGSQPSLRFSSEGLGDVRNSIICHNRMLPGAGSGGDSGGSHYAAGSVTGVVWDSNTIILDKGSYYGTCLATSFGGTTFRNNICLKTATNMEFPTHGPSGTLYSAFSIATPGLSNEQTIGVSNRFYNNTLASLDQQPGYQPYYDDAFILVLGSGGTATPFSLDVKNNIVKAPQLANFVSYWFFNHASAPRPAEVTAARNIFDVAFHRTHQDRFFNYPWTFWGPSGEATNSTQDPQFQGFPTSCRPALTKRLAITGASLSGDGIRGFITKSGGNYGNLKVLRNSRITVQGTSKGPLALYGARYCNTTTWACDTDPTTGPANYDALYGMTVYDSINDTIILAHDIRTLPYRTQSLLVDITAEYSPSTSSKVYVFDNSPFALNDNISYDFEQTPRRVTGVGSDAEGSFITISPALAERPTTFVCKWPSNTTPGLDLRLKDSSPAYDSGHAVPVFTDFASRPRPAGLAWDIGAYER